MPNPKPCHPKDCEPYMWGNPPAEFLGGKGMLGFPHSRGCAYCALNRPIPYWPTSRVAL